MKKFFLLLALILIFSVFGCQKNDKKGCEPNPCEVKEHSTGVCEKKDRSYICECEENYFWVPCSDWLYCNECVNPCLPNKYKSNPCGNPETLKECIPKSAIKYSCVCKDGFRWNGVECVSD